MIWETTEATGSKLNLGNNSKQGARQCGCGENLNYIENNNDLGNDESDAVKVEF